MDEYKWAVEILKVEISEIDNFASEKNKEIEAMMPPEFEKFNIESRNFFAGQHGENFRLKKELVVLEKDVESLKE